MRVHHYFKEQTVRKRLSFLRQQVSSIEDRYNLNVCPPGLCNFCRNFWYDHGMEDDDYGCNASGSKVDKCDKEPYEITRCRYFLEHENWKLEAESCLNDVLWKALTKIAPYAKTLEQVKQEIETLKADKKKLISDIQQEIDWKKKELEGLLPAEIFARVSAWEPKKTEDPTII